MYVEKIEQLRKDNPFLSYTDIVYDLVLDDIIWNRFEPGIRLKETVLSEWCGLSRSPIKEALNRLCDEGYLYRADLPGYGISPFNIADYSDYCELRLSIEPQAAFCAARFTTEKESKALKQLITEYKQSADAGLQATTLHMLDYKYHQEIIRISRNRYFIEIYEQYKRKNLFFRTMMHDMPINTHYIMHKHLQIYKKISEHDERGAMEEMRAHLELNLKRGINMLNDTKPEKV